MIGKILWIGVRPERKAPLIAKLSVQADVHHGLSGDHDSKPHRQVTLISAEELEKTAKLLGQASIDPARTRRNILISGLDFNMPPGTQMRLGEAVIEITGPCLPCSRMDETLGEGGRAAMAEAGGLTARIIIPGEISVGDTAKIVLQAVRAQPTPV